MIDRIAVAVDKTFVEMRLLRVVPKTQRKEKDNPNSEEVHAHDKNGVPKWVVYLSVEVKSFDKTRFDNLEVTVTSPNKPGEGYPENCKVTIDGLTQGQMPLGKGKAVTVFYTAEAIRPLQPAQLVQPGQPQRMAAPQPQPQPVRVANQ